MKKITTADCRNFLATDPQVQQTVADRSGYTDYKEGDGDLDYVQMTWVDDGKNPTKWRRQAKYKVGSQVDLMGGNMGGGLDYANNEYVQQLRGVDPTGGVVRDFWLEGTDHVTIALLEKDGKLYFLDDLSD